MGACRGKEYIDYPQANVQIGAHPIMDVKAGWNLTWDLVQSLLITRLDLLGE